MYLAEGIEELRFNTTKQVMEAMAKLAADPKAAIADRLKAAKIVDGMSDSLIKFYLLSEVNAGNEKMGNKLVKQLDKLTEKEEEL